MKKLLFVVVLMTTATAAFADTATLQLVGAPYGTTGPYDMKVNGVDQKLVCGSDVNFITMYEQWTADVYTIANVDTNPYFTKDPAKWNMAALFADLLLQNPGVADLQNDVWAALGLGGHFDVFWYGKVTDFLGTHAGYKTTDVFYIPVQHDYAHDPNYPYGVPQPFFGVAEPSSLMLFGSGLITAAGVVRRKVWI